MSTPRPQRIEVVMDRGTPTIIEPTSADRERVRMRLKSVTFTLSPEEAYVIGSSLCECAEECGFDYNTGETRRAA